MPKTSHSTPSKLPRVTVLMATFNGSRWLDEQIDSILNQVGVAVTIIARDDLSTDGTAELLARRAEADPRVRVLKSTAASGSAAANFLRILVEADLDDAGNGNGNGADFIAFADQDDIWLPGKLARHAARLAAGDLDGLSSDVIAFSDGGERSLVRKSYPQRDFDYLLESPGPGSTFLLTPRLAELVRGLVADSTSNAATVDFHDWLIYVVCRARGWNWHIDDVPSVEYRQHDSNAMGANVGARSAQSRLNLIRQHWHRCQAAMLAEIALSVVPAENQAPLERMQRLIARPGLRNRFALARSAAQLRRRPRDRAIIGMLIALGVW
jgi:rhamnosyltransferase